MCSGSVSSSCSTSGTRRVNLVTKPIISHECLHCKSFASHSQRKIFTVRDLSVEKKLENITQLFKVRCISEILELCWKILARYIFFQRLFDAIVLVFFQISRLQQYRNKGMSCGVVQSVNDGEDAGLYNNISNQLESSHQVKSII